MTLNILCIILLAMTFIGIYFSKELTKPSPSLEDIRMYINQYMVENLRITKKDDPTFLNDMNKLNEAMDGINNDVNGHMVELLLEQRLSTKYFSVFDGARMHPKVLEDILALGGSLHPLRESVLESLNLSYILEENIKVFPYLQQYLTEGEFLHYIGEYVKYLEKKGINGNIDSLYKMIDNSREYIRPYLLKKLGSNIKYIDKSLFTPPIIDIMINENTLNFYNRVAKGDLLLTKDQWLSFLERYGRVIRIMPHYYPEAKSLFVGSQEDYDQYIKRTKAYLTVDSVESTVSLKDIVI